MSTLDHLPEELIAIIISYLNKPSKLQCLSINSRWRQLSGRVLFKTLSFNSEEDLKKTAALLEQGSDIGTLTRKLEINYCDLAQNFLLTLPTLFPNLREFSYQVHIPDEQLIFQDSYLFLEDYNNMMNLKNWSKLAKFSSSEKIPILSLIACFPPCVNLTELNVSFEYLWPYRSFDRGGNAHNIRLNFIRQFTEMFVEALKNNHTLTDIKLSCCMMTLHDMEMLHKNAPKLKNLELKNMLISPDEEDIMIDRNQAIQLNSLGFGFFMYKDKELMKWMKYVEAKYKDIFSLSISFESHYYHNLEEAVLNILHRSPNVKHFRNDFNPVTRKLIDTLDHLGIQLDKLTLSLPYEVDEVSIKRQLKLVESSKQAASITQLDYAHSLESMCVDLRPFYIARLPNLINLKMHCGEIYYDAVIMILNEIPNLETLSVDGVMFDEDDYTEESPPPIIEVPKTKIKNLSLSLSNSFCRIVCTTTVNWFLKYTFHSCLLLEQFKFGANLEIPFVNANLKIHFTDKHTDLRYIEVDCIGCTFFTFKRVKSKQGLKLTNTLKDKLTNKGFPFDVDLCWPSSIDNQLEVKIHYTDNCYAHW